MEVSAAEEVAAQSEGSDGAFDNISRDDSVQAFFCHKHDEDPELTGVYALAMSPDTRHPMLGCCGGADETAHLFLASCSRDIAVLLGAHDSISCAQFTNDGAFVACASLDGIIRIYQVPEINEEQDSEPSRLEPWCELSGAGGDIELMCVHPTLPAVIGGCADGCIYAWQFSPKTPATMRLMSVVPAHGEPVTALVFGADGSHVISSSADGTVAVSDLNSASVITKVRLGSEGSWPGAGVSLALVSGTNQSEVVLVGTSDTGVYMVNFAGSGTVRHLPGNYTQSVEALAFIPIGQMLHFPACIAGDVDGNLIAYDLSSCTIRWETKSEAGFTRAGVISGTPIAAFTTNEGTVVMADIRSGIKHTYQGHYGCINALALPHNVQGFPYIVTGGDDGAVLVFSLVDEE